MVEPVVSYLSTGEAARVAGVSRQTLLRAVRQGTLRPALRTPGGRYRFSLDTVEGFARQAPAPRPGPRTHRDPLTGLPDRMLYEDRCDQALLAAERGHTELAVLMLSLADLAAIGGGAGYTVTDLVLREAALRARSVVRASDTVARLGRDEIALLLPYTGEAGAIRVANRIRGALAAPIQAEGRWLDPVCTIGIAIFPAHGLTHAALLRTAAAAMREARQAGGGYVVGVPAGEHEPSGRRGLAAALRAAIAHGQLRLRYQPIVRCADGAATRCEALVYWQHPEHGAVSPDRFIPLAEQAGILTPLTLWVLEEALRQCRAWDDRQLAIGVSVNVSIITVQEPQFPDLVAALLRHYGIPAARLTIEITESTLMEQPEQALTVLESLAALGVRLAIDDFGTGHSSLARLRHLPAHELKVDRSFLRQAMGERDTALLSFVLGLGSALGLDVVVEGVESQEHWDWLVGLGCPAIQGYHASRPLAPDALASWLQERITG